MSLVLSSKNLLLEITLRRKVQKWLSPHKNKSDFFFLKANVYSVGILNINIWSRVKRVCNSQCGVYGKFPSL